MIDPVFKKYFIITSTIFVIIFLLSIFVFPNIYQMHEISRDQVRILSITPPQDFFRNIFINNLVVSFIIVMCGLSGLEAIPIIFLSYNAFYIGELIAALNKPDTYMMIYTIVPHGIIEFPMMIIAATFGCCLAYRLKQSTGTRHVLEYLRKRNVNINKIVYDYGIKKYVIYILPMVIIAAIIESEISLYILRIIFNGS